MFLFLKQYSYLILWSWRVCLVEHANLTTFWFPHKTCPHVVVVIWLACFLGTMQEPLIPERFGLICFVFFPNASAHQTWLRNWTLIEVVCELLMMGKSVAWAGIEPRGRWYILITLLYKGCDCQQSRTGEMQWRHHRVHKYCNIWRHIPGNHQTSKPQPRHKAVHCL